MTSLKFKLYNKATNLVLLPILKVFFAFMCMRVYMLECLPRVCRYPWKPEEGIRSARAGAGAKSHMRSVWETQVGPLQQYQANSPAPIFNTLQKREQRHWALVYLAQKSQHTHPFVTMTILSTFSVCRTIYCPCIRHARSCSPSGCSHFPAQSHVRSILVTNPGNTVSSLPLP